MKKMHFYKILFINLIFLFLITGCSTDSSDSEGSEKKEYTVKLLFNDTILNESKVSQQQKISLNFGDFITDPEITEKVKFLNDAGIKGSTFQTNILYKDKKFTTPFDIKEISDLNEDLNIYVKFGHKVTIKYSLGGEKELDSFIIVDKSNLESTYSIKKQGGIDSFLKQKTEETTFQQNLQAQNQFFDKTNPLLSSQGGAVFNKDSQIVADKIVWLNLKQNKKNIQFTYSSSLSYYPEANANDGAIDNSQFITVTVVSGNFIDEVANNANFTKDNHFTTANLPAGLTMQVTKLSSTTAKITFSGKATSHTLANNISNGKITFLAAAIKEIPIQFDGTESKSDIKIKFLAEPTFTFTSQATAPAFRGPVVPFFIEVDPDDGDDDGKIDNTKPSMITLGGTGVFSEDVDVGSAFPADNYELSVNGVAGQTRGYTVVVTKLSSTTARITLEGKYDVTGLGLHSSRSSPTGLNDYSIRFILKSNIIEGPAKLGADKDTNLGIIFNLD